MKFLDRLGQELLFFDGAMGTMLQSQGLKAGEMPELWNLTHKEIILDIHKSYLDAGCNIVKANTFGINPFKMDHCEELTEKGIELAKQAVAETGKEAFTALDIGSLGRLLSPMGDLPFEEAYEAFKPICIAGERAGADLCLIETMNDTYEIKAAVLAAKENTSLPILVTMVCDENGKLLTGADMEAVTAMLEGLKVHAIGLNCGFGPDKMKDLLVQLRKICSLPLVVNPNAGLPQVINGKTCYHVEPQEFATVMKEIALEGISVMGGCCGTTPAHIKALVDTCKGIAPLKVTDKNRSVVSSYTHAVVLDQHPKIIGERINPTGKSRFKQALRDNDLEYIYREALVQQEKGAQILDVNVGLPEIDEREMMKKVITGLQGITDLPLQIDTSDIECMETALRLYNGKPLLNSVNGKQESMDAIFPLAAKYGGMVVCLTLDENGIPETAEGRIRIAERMIKEAAKYGISQKDLLIDTLTMAISTGQDHAKITLEALHYVRHVLGVHTTLGVSNISFGLPQREKVTTAFFTMALANGLSAGIVNPNSASIMAAYHAFCTLNGSDIQCADYIRLYSQQTEEHKSEKSSKEEPSLCESVIKGLTQSAYEAAKKELKTRQPLSIIDQDLIPALDQVGQGFENKTLFLPQLLMSAEAAKAGFSAIKEHLQSQGTISESKGTIVIATVKGDIHDIGKNIVKVLLENYGFYVIDLGKDVPAEKIVQAVKENHVKLVGLSALMTTTVVNMKETIQMLKKEAPECRIMVGGAVLTQNYADMIGADFYSGDAMGSVRYANELFSQNIK
ncbi:MAG: dihydropteroate synthase [Lachnospiraceae bacterium]|nr:dihydropteroate synthase [Lachnospiraceae bacterium]